MLETYRNGELDYKRVLEKIVEGTSNYVTRCGIKAMVLGISGGIDSTVTAAICHIVRGATNVPLIGISLPCSSNMQDEVTSADLCGREFCDEFSTFSLEGTFKSVSASLLEATRIEETPISQGNVKARLRMLTLYDIASKRGGIVMDTDNLTEMFLGFFTRHGDEGDFNPIGCLWKHEIYGLARHLKEMVFTDSEALEHALAIVPTDGNGVKDGGDLAQIAPEKTYDDVDDILHTWVGLHPSIKREIAERGIEGPVIDKLAQRHGIEAVKMVIMRSIRSEFKRRHSPLVVDIFNGNILTKDGNIVPNINV